MLKISFLHSNVNSTESFFIPSFITSTNLLALYDVFQFVGLSLDKMHLQKIEQTNEDSKLFRVKYGVPLYLRGNNLKYLNINRNIATFGIPISTLRMLKST